MATPHSQKRTASRQFDNSETRVTTLSNMTAVGHVYGSLWGDVEGLDPSPEMLCRLGMDGEDFFEAQCDIYQLMRDFEELEVDEEHDEDYAY